MKVESLRPSFTVFLISSDPESMRSPGRVFTEAGYVCLYFSDMASAFSEVLANPPHFIIYDFNEQKFDLKQAFQEVRTQLPETHQFLLTPAEHRARAADFFALGLYDMLLTPVASAREWIRALDRACERDYYMYMNEQLQKVEVERSDMGRLMALHQQLRTRTNAQDCVQDFLDFGAEMLGDCSAIYLRSFPLRKVLAATHGRRLLDWKGIGVNLADDPNFIWASLKDPQSVAPIRDMVREVFKRSDFQAITFEVGKEINGVAIFLAQRPSPDAINTLHLARELVQTSASLLEAEKRLHSLTIKDEVTGVANRNYFIERSSAELIRARRSQHPMSVLFISVDQLPMAIEKGGMEEGNNILRTLAKVIERHSRVNDLVAKFTSSEFAILLPDTDLAGAAVKGERLRRMIEAGDFSRVLQFTPQLTISVGASEYPSICRDIDELFETADEALMQVKAKTNRVCLASPPNSFTPDFVLDGKI